MVEGERKKREREGPQKPFEEGRHGRGAGRAD